MFISSTNVRAVSIFSHVATWCHSPMVPEYRRTMSTRFVRDRCVIWYGGNVIIFFPLRGRSGDQACYVTDLPLKATWVRLPPYSYQQLVNVPIVVQQIILPL